MMRYLLMSTTLIPDSNVSRLVVIDSRQHSSLISSQGILIFNCVVWAVVAQAVVVFGVIGNIINMICFVKQGFKDSINVSLTGLAISDLGCLLPLLWANISYTPAFSNLDLPFDVSEVQFMTSGITHVMLTRVSSWITAMITLERCLCVSMPLKFTAGLLNERAVVNVGSLANMWSSAWRMDCRRNILCSFPSIMAIPGLLVKNIATPRRTCIVVASIFLILTASGCPQYLYYRLGLKYFPVRNKTLVGIVYTEGRDTFEKFAYPVNFVFVPYCAFIVITVCTIKLVVQLKSKAEWRKKSATTEEAAKLTNTNKKVAKMVVMISTLFICCFIPISVTCILIIAIPGFSIDGELGNFITVLGGMGFLLESVNSSANIVIYYRMSTKFRDTFHKTFMKRVGSKFI